MPNPNIIEFKNDPSVELGSSVKLDPGMRPRRVVIRSLPGKFVTHMELMRVDVETRTNEEGRTYDVVVCSHESFDQGHYFDHRNYPDVQAAWRAAAADYENRKANW